MTLNMVCISILNGNLNGIIHHLFVSVLNTLIELIYLIVLWYNMAIGIFYLNCAMSGCHG